MEIYNSFGKYLKQIRKELLDFKIANTQIGVSVSGGSDSMALLLLLWHYANENNIGIKVYTVDHGLRANSKNEAAYVVNFANTLNLKSEIITWTPPATLPKNHVQKCAREFRYKSITSKCVEDKIKLLFTGHTANDQMETYLLRESKNSSGFGLAAMSAITSIQNGVLLIRPLLKFNREELRKYLLQQNVNWVEDPSNKSETYLRVQYRNKLQDNIALQEEVTRKLEFYGQLRNESDIGIHQFIKNNVILKNFSASVPLPNKLNNPSDIIYLNALRKIIWHIGGANYPVNITVLSQKLYNARKCTIGRCVIEFLSNPERILIYRENKNFEEIEFFDNVFWDNRFLIKAKIPGEYLVSNLGTKYIRELKQKIKKNNSAQIIPNDKYLISMPGIYDKDGSLVSIPTVGYNALNFVVEFSPSVNFERNFVIISE